MLDQCCAPGSAGRAAEKACQPIVDGRILGYRDFRPECLTSKLRLEVFSTPRQRVLRELEPELRGLPGGLRQVPRVHGEIAGVLAEGPRRRKLTQPGGQRPAGA